jgi:hypothetical protein
MQKSEKLLTLKKLSHLEDIQRSQLGVLEEVNANILSLLNQIRYGAAGAREVVSNTVGLENIARIVSKEVSNVGPDYKKVGSVVNESIQSLTSLITNKQSGQITDFDFNSQIKKLQEKFTNLPEYISEKTSNAFGNIISNIKGTSSAEKATKSLIENFKKVIDTGKIDPIKTQVRQIPNIESASVFGSRGASVRQIAEMTKMQQSIKVTSQKVDLGGVITIKIDAPPGVSVEYLNKTLTNLVNSESFIQQIVKMTKQVDPTKMKSSK